MEYYFDFIKNNNNNTSIEICTFTKAWKRFVVASIVYFFCTILFFDIYHIHSNSMFPMLQGKNIKANDDHIIALKGIFMLSPLKRGDMIIFISPEDKQRFLVKRLVAEPGDEVYIKEENSLYSLYVNGTPVVTPSIFRNIEYIHHKHHMESNVPLQGWGSIPLHIPANNYFVLGDNSKDSRDSRMWGWLPGDYIVGKVYAICYPFYRAQIFNY